MNTSQKRMHAPDPSPKHLVVRDSLSKEYLQMLQLVPRGDVAAWMACGCIVAAEAFERGLATWHMRMSDVKGRGLNSAPLPDEVS